MFRTAYLLAILLLTGASTQLPAQQKRVSAKEVEKEERFIDANREHLLGNYDKAIPLYEEILKEDADNHAVAYELARIYNEQEVYDKSVRYAKQAVELAPANVWYQQLLAEVYQKVGSNEEAAAVYERLVRSDPQNEDYYFKWAYYLVRANELQKAVKVYDQLESRIGVTEELIRRKHALYLGSGDTRRAGKELERLIEAFPDDLSYQHLLAEFYQEIGEPKKARAVYNAILEIDPNNAKAKLALTGPPEASSDELQYLQSLRPIFEQPDVALDLKIKRIMPIIQEVANTSNRSLGEAALELTGLLEEQHPENAKPYAASADLLYYIGRRGEAIAKYEKTLTLDDTVFPVWEQLLYAYREEQDYAALAERAEAAMDYFPNQPTAYWMYGIAANELGDNEDALSALQQALLMASGNDRMRFNVQSRLGLVYEALGRPQEATEAFEAALELNPEGLALLNDYSYVLAQRGEQLDRALEMAKLVNDLRPDQPAYQDTYGWVHYKMKEYNKAKRWIGEALQNGGDEDPRILEHYGDVLFQLDDQDGALRYWMLAQEKGSQSKLLEKKINDKQLYE